MSNFECGITKMKNAISCSFFKKEGTSVYCNINFNTKSNPDAIIEVKWNEGQSNSANEYSAGIIKEVILPHLNDEFERNFLIEFWVSANKRNTLACAFNAAILAIIDTGIELTKMLYAVDFDQNKEGFAVFDDEKAIFIHSLGDFTDDDIKECSCAVNEIKKKIRSKIENKFIYKY